MINPPSLSPTPSPNRAAGTTALSRARILLSDFVPGADRDAPRTQIQTLIPAVRP